MSSSGQELTPALALHIIDRMGSVGQPPEFGLSYVNVGNENVLKIIDEEYLDKLAGKGRGSAFKLVQGYYGGGKTHLLRCVQDLARKRGFLTALVSLSPQECSYEDPFSVYKAVCANICMSPEEDFCLPVQSFPDILRVYAEDKLDGFSPEERSRWFSRVGKRIPVDDHSFRKASMEFMRCVLEGDDKGESALESWLRGDSGNQSTLKDYGIFVPLGRTNAFKCLCSMLQLIAGLGFPGTVLLFDEVDRNLSLSSRKLAALGDNLRQIVDLCGSSRLPGVLFFYAVPPEFMRNIVPNYPALDQRLSCPLSMSRRSPQATIIDLQELDYSPKDMLMAIGERLLKVCCVAWNWNPNLKMQKVSLSNLAMATGKYEFEIGHRRKFVKLWIAFLSRQYYSDSEMPLSLDEAVNMLQSCHEDDALAADSVSDDDRLLQELDNELLGDDGFEDL